MGALPTVSGAPCPRLQHRTRHVVTPLACQHPPVHASQLLAQSRTGMLFGFAKPVVCCLHSHHLTSCAVAQLGVMSQPEALQKLAHLAHSPLSVILWRPAPSRHQTLLNDKAFA